VGFSLLYSHYTFHSTSWSQATQLLFYNSSSVIICKRKQPFLVGVNLFLAFTLYLAVLFDQKPVTKRSPTVAIYYKTKLWFHVSLVAQVPNYQQVPSIGHSEAYILQPIWSCNMLICCVKHSLQSFSSLIIGTKAFCELRWLTVDLHINDFVFYTVYILLCVYPEYLLNG